MKARNGRLISRARVVVSTCVAEAPRGFSNQGTLVEGRTLGKDQAPLLGRRLSGRVFSALSPLQVGLGYSSRSRQQRHGLPHSGYRQAQRKISGSFGMTMSDRKSVV